MMIETPYDIDSKAIREITVFTNGIDWTSAGLIKRVGSAELEGVLHLTKAYLGI